jgi:hypothetical protein
VLKICDGEMTASSTNIIGKSGYSSAKHWNCIHVYYLVLVSTW